MYVQVIKETPCVQNATQATSLQIWRMRIHLKCNGSVWRRLGLNVREKNRPCLRVVRHTECPNWHDLLSTWAYKIPVRAIKNVRTTIRRRQLCRKVVVVKLKAWRSTRVRRNCQIWSSNAPESQKPSTSNDVCAVYPLLLWNHPYCDSNV